MTAATTHSVVIERELPHSPEKIWRALTQGPLIKEWLMDNDFQPVVGHNFNFRSTPMPQWNGIIDCEVRVVEPNRKLAYSWGALERCLVPDFDGAFLSRDSKDALWDKFYTAAPPRRRQSVEQYKIVKRA